MVSLTHLPHKPLSEQEELFFHHFMECGKPEKAALLAGYAPSTARVKSFGWANLEKCPPNKLHVARAIYNAKLPKQLTLEQKIGEANEHLQQTNELLEKAMAKVEKQTVIKGTNGRPIEITHYSYDMKAANNHLVQLSKEVEQRDKLVAKLEAENAKKAREAKLLERSSSSVNQPIIVPEQKPIITLMPEPDLICEIPPGFTQEAYLNLQQQNENDAIAEIEKQEQILTDIENEKLLHLRRKKEVLARANTTAGNHEQEHIRQLSNKQSKALYEIEKQKKLKNDAAFMQAWILKPIPVSKPEQRLTLAPKQPSLKTQTFQTEDRLEGYKPLHKRSSSPIDRLTDFRIRPSEEYVPEPECFHDT